MSPPTAPVGVLALQGSAPNHVESLACHGVPTRLVRAAADLEGLTGLVLPGGESTTMLKLLRRFDMQEALARAVRRLLEEERPVLATCAGLILLARRVTRPEQESLGLLDVDVERNAYGRQLASGTVPTSGRDGFPDAESVFIRAPRITRTGPEVRVLATRGPDPVAVEQGTLLGATFHPEATPDHPLSLRFVRRLQTGG